MGADGAIVRPLDEAAARRGLRTARRAGLTSVAIALLHGYALPEHERRLAVLARTTASRQISTSHEVSAARRSSSAAARRPSSTPTSPPSCAATSISVASRLPGVRARFMQSHGGLTDARLFRGKDAILSGPAGGIVGAVETCRRAGSSSSSPSTWAARLQTSRTSPDSTNAATRTAVAGVRLRSPMFRIHTVAAGGGSVCTFEQGRYRVGPGSAGADPGPACYGKGGPLTVTDCNVVLGKLRPAFFPAVFGPRSDAPIDVEAAREALAAVAASMREAGLETPSPEQLADDFVSLACDTMARAIKRVSTQRGFDITGYTLCCFGGAAGTACLSRSPTPSA